MSAANIIKSFEGCKLVGYPDIKGVPTIGWGHTGPEVYIGLVWTQAQADDALVHDLAEATLLLQRYSPGPFAPGALDALTDFVFNEGSGHYRTSHLMTYVNAQNWSAVKTELLKWEYAGGHVVAGLERRRQAEADLIGVA
jgi:lysozyme